MTLRQDRRLGATCLAIKTKQVGGATEFDWKQKILISWRVCLCQILLVLILNRYFGLENANVKGSVALSTWAAAS